VAADNSTLIRDITALKMDKKAVILAHNYQLGEVQDIADYVGDSLGLARIAAETDAEVIVFCGVHFMAETASILCPDKKILLPDLNSGCPMADMITANDLREMKKEIPGARAVCYVNTTAEVKAECHICCTSANAVKVIESLPPGEIIFVPDQYLGKYIESRTGRRMHLWPGFCPTHARIMPDDIVDLRRDYPEAKVIVHPECRPEVIALADEALSTGGMCRYAKESGAKEIIVGTEIGIIYRLKKENPNKKFIQISEQAVCPNMKLVTLEKIIDSLKTMAPEVSVSDEIRKKAKASVDRMLNVA